MLKITVLGLISAILAASVLCFKSVVYDLKDESGVADTFALLDFLKDFVVIFMMLWYVLK